MHRYSGASFRAWMLETGMITFLVDNFNPALSRILTVCFADTTGTMLMLLRAFSAGVCSRPVRDIRCKVLSLPAPLLLYDSGKTQNSIPLASQAPPHSRIFQYLHLNL